MISESATQKHQSPGRPPRFDGETLAVLRNDLGPKKHRCLVDIAYYQEVVLRHWQTKFGWLSSKQGIMTELGQLETAKGSTVMLQAAKKLIGWTPRPTVKQAVVWLRNHRLGNEARAGNAEQLANDLRRALAVFLQRYPGTGSGTIGDAILQFEKSLRCAQATANQRPHAQTYL